MFYDLTLCAAGGPFISYLYLIGGSDSLELLIDTTTHSPALVAASLFAFFFLVHFISI